MSLELGRGLGPHAMLAPRCLVAALLLLLAAGCRRGLDERPITISVVGTSDVHGSLLPVDGNRGLTLFSGYVDNLRKTRAEDDGVVLLIDAGDMWQGTLESNLSEGASIVAAFNAMGYDAAAIGNHEFDFGPVGERATPASDSDDPRGALKQRASESDFPLLAANLIDETTGELVDWPNVRPSVLIERGGVQIGIIGLIAANALTATLDANVRGLRVAPLAPAAEREARKLRDAGAELVIITAHAGSRCESFDDPYDLSSCNLDGEIMRVARDLRVGLVDQIVAGHHHQGIAHEVNGIAVISSFSSSRAFGRVDHVLDRRDHSLISRTIYPPQFICGSVDAESGECAASPEASATSRPARYSGDTVMPNPNVLAIAERAAERVRQVKSQTLGVELETPITRAGGGSSALGRLFTDAMLEALGGDIAIHNVVGGIRADLPQGELTYGAVYEAFPFDNRAVQFEVTGAELREVLKAQISSRRRAGISGIRVLATCGENGSPLGLTMLRADGTEINDGATIVVTTTDFLATGGDDVFTSILPEGGFPVASDAPLVRDVLADWMRRHQRLDAHRFLNAEPSWSLPDPLPQTCGP